MVLKENYSTGEAAQLLGISRSTISRKFDMGVLLGKKNPITGDRLISRESITTLMKLYNIPQDALAPEKKTVYISTPDPKLLPLLSRIFEQDPCLHIEKLPPEASVLDECIESVLISWSSINGASALRPGRWGILQKIRPSLQYKPFTALTHLRICPCCSVVKRYAKGLNEHILKKSVYWRKGVS